VKEHIHFNSNIFKKFLEKHDMVYEVPAEEWERGLPMGNAIVSSVIWGGNPIKVTLDRQDIWEIRSAFKPDKAKFKWKKFCEKFEQKNGGDVDDFYQTEAGPTPQHLPIGRFELKLKGELIQNYHMRLKLYDAVSEGGYDTEFGGITWRSYVSADLPVIIFDYELRGNEETSLKFRFVAKQEEYSVDMKLAKDSGASVRTKKNMGMFITGYNGEVPEFAQILKDWGYPDNTYGKIGQADFFEQTIPENGNYSIAWNQIEGDGNRKIVIVTLITDRVNGKAQNIATEQIEQISNFGKIKLMENNHKTWWHNYYPKSFISFPDTKLEGLYWIEMYKLGCIAREDGIPMTISGIWVPDDGLGAFCASDYHWNMQQQGNLWPIYVANRLELGFSTYNLIENARSNMANFCRDFFDCEGQFLTHCSDLDGKPLFINQDQFEFCGLPWMCQLMWLHYKYSMNFTFLKERLYPLMREAVRPLINELKMGDDGKLHLPWTSSPEYHGSQETFRFPLEEEPDWSARFGPDSTIDLALLRFLCETLLETVKILELTDEESESWENTLDNLVPYTLDRFGGLMVRGDLPLSSSHRHFSHLFPIHPLHQITFDNPEEKKIIDASMLALDAHGRGEWMGWSYPQMASLCIRAERIPLARMLLMDFVDKIINENTFHMQGSNYNCEMILHENYGQTVEAGLMCASVITDFACCSFNNEIKVFYYTPKAWDEASFWNLRAEGAFLVSAKRKNGITKFIGVFSEVGGICKILSDIGTDLRIVCRKKEIPFEIKDGKIIFQTEAGNEYIITCIDSDIIDYSIQPVISKPHEQNFFGLKKRSRY